MILDKENMMSYKQAITVTAVSTNVIDLGPNHHMGASGNDKPIPVIIAIDEVFTDVGSDATLRVQLKSSNAEAFGSGVKIHYDRTFTFAELLQSGKLEHGMSLPPDVQRYVRTDYTVASGPFTAGKITVGVAASRQTNG
jgi:hypothetical protein